MSPAGEVERAGITIRDSKGFGWKPDLPDIRDHLFAVDPPRKLKPVASLRSKMPKPYHQGNLNSCTANAIAANLEYDAKKQGHKGVKTPSRLFIYYNERVIEDSVEEDSGAFLRDGIKTVAKLGAPPEDPSWPYEEAKVSQKPPGTAYKEARKHQALSYARVPQTVTSLQSVIASGLPVIFGFAVYESFESEEVANTGIVPLPSPDETLVGGHAVLLVGYRTNPTTGGLSFEVRNSWGSDWGDKGYGWFPASYLTQPALSADFWTIRIVE